MHVQEQYATARIQGLDEAVILITVDTYPVSVPSVPRFIVNQAWIT